LVAAVALERAGNRGFCYGARELDETERDRIMAGGWAKDGAVQDQIDASVEDAVNLARSRLPQGNSLSHCAECGAEIPEARRSAIPGVRLCVQCQTEIDARQTKHSGYNRRGSKDSQLR
jgi:phage/conjugal plasmid C-4 type zinc finger TraR family protein